LKNTKNHILASCLLRSMLGPIGRVSDA
jgi:hypothetical protein